MTTGDQHPSTAACHLYAAAIDAWGQRDRLLAATRLNASLGILLRLSEAGDHRFDHSLTMISESVDPFLFAAAVKVLPQLLAFRVTGGTA